jgi:hypothetical protein
MTLKSSVIIGAIIAALLSSSSIWSSVSVYASVSEGPKGDVCGPNLFLNEDGECIPDRECRSISVITTDECQPKNPRN